MTSPNNAVPLDDLEGNLEYSRSAVPVTSFSKYKKDISQLQFDGKVSSSSKKAIRKFYMEQNEYIETVEGLEEIEEDDTNDGQSEGMVRFNLRLFSRGMCDFLQVTR
jgi:hypothetical protein